MVQLGHSVQFYCRSGEFRAVVGFVDAYLFILAIMAFFLPANRLAFVAVSLGAAKYLFAGKLPFGRLHIGGHHQSSSLSDRFAVAATTPGHGARSTNLAASHHFNRIPSRARHSDLSADDERLRGVRAFSQVAGTRAPGH